MITRFLLKTEITNEIIFLFFQLNLLKNNWKNKYINLFFN